MFLATFSTNAFCQSAHQWTLQECIDYAIANNISLKKNHSPCRVPPKT